MRSKFIAGPVVIGLAALFTGFSPAVLAKDTCTVSSIQLVGATPGTINDDGEVTAGTPVTVRGVTTQASPATGSNCDAGIGGAAVTSGTMRIEAQVDDFGVPRDCRSTGVGAFSTLKTQAVGSNIIEHPFDTTGLDEIRGFRTDYQKANPGGTFVSSKSVCVDLTINPSASPCDAYDDVVVLTVVGGAGKGQVAPGDVGPWSYTLEVLNCTGIDDLPVKVQGGTSGWTTYTGGSTAPVEPFTATAKSNGKKGTTSTVTWNTLLDDEEAKTITVEVDGVIPNGVYDGEWMHLSGAWSAAYDDGNPATCTNISPKTGTCNPNGGTPDKSDYTPRVYLEVLLP